MPHRSGRHFLQIPGPTNVPDRVLHAIAHPTIDHRSGDFAALTHEIMAGLKRVFKTSGPVLVFPSSATGAWEAAFVNTLSPGDSVLAIEIGEFARLWAEVGKRLGLDVQVIDTDWTRAVSPETVEAALRADVSHRIKAVLVVHNETSTGATTNVAAVRQAIDRAGHPALLLVDAVSSIGSIDLCHEAWGIDVTIAGSQKGLMMPPGLSFNAVSEKALQASRTASLPKSYWAWEPMLTFNAQGFFTYTPSTNLLFGLRESLRMLEEEGLDAVFARHRRLARAARAAVRGWGLDIFCGCSAEQSPVVTTVLMPGDHNSDHFKRVALEQFDLSLGAGLGRLKGRAFRIGHLGDFNALMLMATLSGVEMALSLANVPFTTGGVLAAMAELTSPSAVDADVPVA